MRECTRTVRAYVRFSLAHDAEIAAARFGGDRRECSTQLTLPLASLCESALRMAALQLRSREWEMMSRGEVVCPLGECWTSETVGIDNGTECAFVCCCRVLPDYFVRVSNCV